MWRSQLCGAEEELAFRRGPCTKQGPFLRAGLVRGNNITGRNANQNSGKRSNLKKTVVFCVDLRTQPVPMAYVSSGRGRFPRNCFGVSDRRTQNGRKVT